MPKIDIKAAAQQHVQETQGDRKGFAAVKALVSERMRLGDLTDEALLAEFDINEGNLPEIDEAAKRKPAPKDHYGTVMARVPESKASYFRERLLIALHDAEIKIRRQILSGRARLSQVANQLRRLSQARKVGLPARASAVGVFAAKPESKLSYLVVGCGHGYSDAHAKKHERIHPGSKGWLSVDASEAAKPDLVFNVGSIGLAGSAYGAKKFDAVFFEGVPPTDAALKGAKCIVGDNLNEGGVIIFNNVYSDSFLADAVSYGLRGEALIFADGSVIVAKRPETDLRVFFEKHKDGLQMVLDLECGFPRQEDEERCLAGLSVLAARRAYQPFLKHLLTVCDKYQCGRNAVTLRNHFKDSAYNGVLALISDSVKAILTDVDCDPVTKLAELHEHCQGLLVSEKFSDTWREANFRVVDPSGERWVNMRDEKAVTANYSMSNVLRYVVGMCDHVKNCAPDVTAAFHMSGAGRG